MRIAIIAGGSSVRPAFAALTAPGLVLYAGGEVFFSWKDLPLQRPYYSEQPVWRNSYYTKEDQSGFLVLS